MATVIPFSGQVDDTERDVWIEAINKQCSRASVVPIEQLSEAERNNTEIAIVASPDPANLIGLPNLKWLQSLWAGVEDLLTADINPATSIVRLTDPQLAQSMADAVLAWCLYLHHDMPQYRQQQNNRIWNPLPPPLPAECNIGIFGIGKLGAAAATRLRLNNYRVRGWSNSEKNIKGVQCFQGKDGFRRLLSDSDIAVILLPLTRYTKHLFDSGTLEQLPAGASIINFARGPVIVETDLLNQLDGGHLKHAVLDVFDGEPLTPEHPFWLHPKVTVLPHISAQTTVTTAAIIAAQNIDRYLSTGVIPACVDRSRGY